MGKIEPHVSGFKINDCYFSGAEIANSYKHVFDEMEEFKGRDRTFASDWLT